MDKQLTNITADETDAPEPPISPKRNREEELLLESATRATEQEVWELAERARKRRKHILKKLMSISELSDATVPFSDTGLSTIADQLRDPAIQTKLPFPSVWPHLPERFKCTGDDNNWDYTGREKFPTLLKAVQTLESSPEWRGCWLYGTIGYGKSHLLAALVCYLIATGRRVVYLPDCRECTWDPCAYVRAAMLFAWGAPEDSGMRKHIRALKTMKRSANFSEDKRRSYLSSIN